MVLQSFLSFVFDPSSYFNNRCIQQQNVETYLWGNLCFTFRRNHLIRKEQNYLCKAQIDKYSFIFRISIQKTIAPNPMCCYLRRFLFLGCIGCDAAISLKLSCLQKLFKLSNNKTTKLKK